jgi:outer membrane protein assembly factor BamB
MSLRNRTRSARILAPLVAAVLVAGCSSMPSWIPSMPSIPSIPAPDWTWLTGGGKSRKPGPLPELTASATAATNWQTNVGRAGPGLAPAITADAVYAASGDGTIMRIDTATGRVAWRESAGVALSAGPGAGTDIVVVATGKGEVLAFGADGKSRWKAQVSSEVTSPPLVGDDVVIVISGDGRVFGLGAADGKTKWVYSRANPPLIVRNYASGATSRGGAFIGMPGGRLVALDMATGTVGWDGTVAVPRGATELERVADVTSRPAVDDRQACAVAYQGRVVCFELVRGTQNWSRDISSLAGIVMDDKYLYVTDEKGAVHALDKGTGASVWKQEKLAERRIGGPQLVGDFVGVVDVEGYLHLITRANGAYVGRLATDGTPPTAQPSAALGTAVWQSAGGNVYAVNAR